MVVGDRFPTEIRVHLCLDDFLKEDQNPITLSLIEQSTEAEARCKYFSAKILAPSGSHMEDYELNTGILEIDELIEYFADTGTTLKIRVSGKIETVGVVSQTSVIKTSNESGDLGSLLLDEGNLKDVLFKIDGPGGKGEVKAHKNVLAVKSDVFGAMFNAEPFKAGGTDVVEVTDATPAEFEKFLSSLYSGNPPPEEYAVGVAKLANKYNVEGVLGDCQVILLKTTNVENVLERYIETHLFLPTLKERCLEVIKRSGIDFFKSGGWQKLIRLDPTAAEDLCKQL